MQFRSLIPAATAIVLALSAVAGPAAAADDAAQGKTVVATVDGEKITRAEIELMKEEMAAQIPQLQAMPLEGVYDGLLNRAINQKLLLAQGRKAGLASDPEVKKQLAEVEDELVRRAWLQKQLEKQVTDAMVKERYDQFVKDNPPEEEVHARHILLDSEEAAKAVIAELNKGADFEALAKEKSTGPSGPRGGDLGWFKKGAMVAEFSDAAFALKPGSVSEAPVKTQFGWHVIKVEDRRTAEPPAFAEVEEQLRAEAAQDAVEKVLADLRDKAKVETFGLDGKPVKK